MTEKKLRFQKKNWIPLL